MNEKVVEVLKENVMKWEEAANSISYWMSNVAESDRVELAARAKQYQRNAQELREFIEQLVVSDSTETIIGGQ